MPDAFMRQMMKNAAAYGFKHPHGEAVAVGKAAVDACIASVKSYNAEAAPLAEREKGSHRLTVGMTKAEVRASLGDPCGTCYGTRHNSWGDTWEYNVFGSSGMGIGSGTIVYFDSSGRVTGWSSP
jgi:hypothetical protein